MRNTARKLQRASFADLLALGEEFRGEIIGGEIVEREAARPGHSNTQGMIRGELHPFGRRSGGRLPGGWWILTEGEVEYETHEVYRHDLAGWRRERLAELPEARPLRIRPDWVCEILSPGNWKHDTVDKLEILRRHCVSYYWIADLERRILTVYRYGTGVYELAGQFVPGQTARLPPFDAIEIEVGVLFGDDPLDT